MCFGTVLDHLDAILVHFEPETENRIFFDFEAILGHFGPFLAFFGPLNSAKSFLPPLATVLKKTQKNIVF